MKRLCLIGFVLLCFALESKSQNLVPNPSFEQHSDCNNIYSYNAFPWCIASSNGGSSAYYNPCQSDQLFVTPRQYSDPCMQSYQIPRTGVAYIDMGNYIMGSSQESVVPQIKLIDTLKAGKTYCVTYYVSVFNNARYTIDKLGALLTATPFPCATLGGTLFVNIAGQYTPQVVSTPSVAIGDTLNWTEVSGSFTAIGNEAHLAIGDFFTHSQHYIQNTYPTNCNGLALYYVDDVSVELVEVAKAKNDTLIYATDSVIIGKNASEAALFSWQPSTGLSCTNCPNPKASPSVSTTYTVTKTQCKSVTTDEITVTVSPVGINELNIINAITLQPNPTNGLISINSRFEMQKIEVINIAGQTLLSETAREKTHQLQLQSFSEGIYFARIIYPNGLSIVKKVIVNH